MTFVHGRQIDDAILIANENIDLWKRKKTRGFVIKIDLEKAFDKISWNFIDFMLKKKNLSKKWGDWIKTCISTVQYSILINGKPRGRIKPKRGIRQGDPISHLIFVLAMDYLSCILKHLENSNKIKGVLINDINLIHLLFANDILLFVEDDDNSIRNLQNAIHLFEVASGLNIHLSKSSISPVNIEKEIIERVANSWGIDTLFFSISYLGMPLGGEPRACSFWDNITEMIHKKLNNWKYAHIPYRH
ncbi:LINE-1 retrotransposable element ORF2 protein [Cucumis melo var. makuwa]|uniref:LINE-1 retrotransposable element ORF2 protein n=1 Tax=Cucumis melo var. makuwa TaxID=1194695 RepID=A0A5D3E3T6_CUCMM|nr:LINE-1 retrotransposable element ORF2 protein [Cucumis melo var. makuwa]TYK30783.1 LINE-1 retrotransposable element ORF2 protein [Cucumis melo var. makuwa]